MASSVPPRGVLTGSVWNDLIDTTATTTFSHTSTNLNGAGDNFRDLTPSGYGSGLLIIDLVGGGQATVGQISDTAGTFFGWTSSVPFTAFEITKGTGSGVETYDMDNLKFATTNVPEPDALGGCWGVGAVGLLWYAGRRRVGQWMH